MKTRGNSLNAKPLLLSGCLLSWDQTCACTDSGRSDLLQQDSLFLPGGSGHSWMLGFTPREKKRGSCCTEKTPRPNVRFSIGEPDQREYQTCCDLQGNTQGAQRCSSSGFPDRASGASKAILSTLSGFGKAELDRGSQPCSPTLSPGLGGSGLARSLCPARQHWFPLTPW